MSRLLHGDMTLNEREASEERLCRGDCSFKALMDVSWSDFDIKS